jgi:hypothetical protein
MKMLFLFQLVSVLIASFSYAQDPSLHLDSGLTPVSVECNFRVTTKVNCNDFIRGFFSNFESVIRRETNLDLASLVLVLTDESLAAQSVRYSFHWTSKDQTQVSDFTLPLIVDQGLIDEVGLLNLLIKNAGKGLVIFLDVMTQKTDDGQIIIVYQPKEDGSAPAQESWLDKLEKSPIYVGLDIHGSYRTTGESNLQSTNLNGSAMGSFIYSKDQFKADLSGYYTYKKISIPSSTGTVSGDASVQGLNSILVYSMARRWSVAAINHVHVDPVSNVDLSMSNGAGVEWTLVPFRSTENKELAFRVGGAHQVLKLGEINDLGNIEEQYFTAFAKVYFFWTLNEGKTVIKLNAGIDQNLKYSGYQNYTFGSTFTFQLNRTTRLNLGGTYSYAAKTLTYPLNPDLSNPVNVQFMHGQAGRNLNLNIGLNVTIGNSLRKTRDRRWTQ